MENPLFQAFGFTLKAQCVRFNSKNSKLQTNKYIFSSSCPDVLVLKFHLSHLLIHFTDLSQIYWRICLLYELLNVGVKSQNQSWSTFWATVEVWWYNMAACLQIKIKSALFV